MKEAVLKMRVVNILMMVLLMLVATILPTVTVRALGSNAYNTVDELLVGVHGAFGLTISDQDISATWSQYLVDKTKWASPTYLDDLDVSFGNAKTSGRWGVSQSVEKYSDGTANVARVFWTEDDSLALNWSASGVSATGNNVHSVSVGNRGYVFGGSDPTPVAWAYSKSGGLFISDNKSLSTMPNGSSSETNFFVYTSNPNYPSGYSGVVRGGSIDNDGDGLNVAFERTQGTSDDKIDSDGDGLSDYVESQWYANREAVFCKTSVTPHVCSYPHPATKDVYVEIDWMHDGTNSFKPTDTQIGMVSDAFAAKGIYFHADTGQYGGGNQLSTYTASLDIPKGSGTDYFDYKDNNFSAGRQGIWRYMIAGNNYSADTTSSGVTYTGSDNIFVSYGLVKGSQTVFGYTDQDTALAGTMIHEIGHSLCLGGTQMYSYQAASCVYGGIDSGSVVNNAYPNYVSSLNYASQMGMVDYSTGINGAPGDHNDWSAIASHMDDFTQWDYDTQHNYSPGASAKSPMAKGITIGIAQKLKAKGLLRPGKATWRHLKVDPRNVPNDHGSGAIGLDARTSRLLMNR